MDWSTKKFNYKIINDRGETIAFVYKKLSELEKFVVDSKLEIESLERKGPNDFVVKVHLSKAWKIG